MDGLTRGLRLVRARNLQVPGADQTFARLLASNSEAVQRAAWESSRHFVLGALMRQARQDALSADLPAAGRVRAVRALRGGNFDAVSPVIETVLHSHPPPEVEASAGMPWRHSTSPRREAHPGQLARLRSDGRRRAVSAMLAQRNRIPLLLKAVEDGQVERSALDASARSHPTTIPTPRFPPRLARCRRTPTQSRTVVASYRDVNLSGDVAHGKDRFQENCARTASRAAGRRIGPDLSGINNKTKEELITSILNQLRDRTALRQLRDHHQGRPHVRRNYRQ